MMAEMMMLEIILEMILDDRDVHDDDIPLMMMMLIKLPMT